MAFISPFPSSSSVPGDGHLVVQLLPQGTSALSIITFQYPLKLISPSPIATQKSALVFLLTYGGGLVGGDQIQLRIDIRPDARLSIVTQGHTKVFKSPSQDVVTRQHLLVTVETGGAVCLLPDPIQPFEGSVYEQSQIFTVAEGGSLCLLDWVSAGRTARGENWDFHKWSGCNEVWTEHPSGFKKRLLLRDNILLDGESRNTQEGFLKMKMQGLGLFGTLILKGSLVASLAAFFLREFAALHRIGAQDFRSQEKIVRDNRSTSTFTIHTQNLTIQYDSTAISSPNRTRRDATQLAILCNINTLYPRSSRANRMIVPDGNNISRLFARVRTLLGTTAITAPDSTPLSTSSETEYVENKLTSAQMEAIEKFGAPETLIALRAAAEPLSEPLVVCAICTIPYHSSNPGAGGIIESPYKLACGHIFGQACIERWLLERKLTEGELPNCPSCRFRLRYRRCGHIIAPLPAYDASTPSEITMDQRPRHCLKCEKVNGPYAIAYEHNVWVWKEVMNEMRADAEIRCRSLRKRYPLHSPRKLKHLENDIAKCQILMTKETADTERRVLSSGRWYL
ncbi:hypothetical protein B7494_g2940 [Chlorociboria aeruginascens]|nr:hypothetical protein B7494_g2940 [Chlorociboria aeruginascens]